MSKVNTKAIEWHFLDCKISYLQENITILFNFKTASFFSLLILCYEVVDALVGDIGGSDEPRRLTHLVYVKKAEA